VERVSCAGYHTAPSEPITAQEKQFYIFFFVCLPFLLFLLGIDVLFGNTMRGYYIVIEYIFYMFDLI